MPRKAKKVNKTNKKVVKHKKPIRKNVSVHKKPMFKAITSTVISTLPFDPSISSLPPPITPPIIVKKDGESWNSIRKICEAGINFHRDYHEIKACDSELARKLNEIEQIARNSIIINQIQHILRSKQTLIDKLRQIYRFASKNSN